MNSDFVLPGACILGLFLLLSEAAVAETGALTQLAGTDACVSEDGTGGDCAEGVALELALGVAISRDGMNVYVGSAGNNAVAAFARDRRTGALAQLPGTDPCISEDGTGGDCPTASRLPCGGA